LQRARVELGSILARPAPTDLPTEFVEADTVAKLSDADRSLVVVLTRVLGPKGLQTYADLLQNTPAEPSVAAFDELPADTDDATRQDIAEHLVPYIRAINAAYPGLSESRADAPGGARFANETIATAMSDLYNAAQLDVLRRAQEILLRDSAPKRRER
jgi:hypothetical protein